jgi:hypothetical protein
MKDFAHYQGEFTKKKGWNEARRRRLLGQLVRIMLCHELKYTGWAKPLSPLKTRPTLQESYNEAYRICILYAEFQAKGEGVNFVFSEHAEISSEVYRLRHDAVRRAYRDRRLGSMTFGDPRYIPQLQAADLVAYELRKHAEDLKKSLRWPLQQLPKDRCKFELW